MFPRVKVFTKTVAMETFAVAATVYRGAGVWRDGTCCARESVLAVAFPRVAVPMGTTVHARTQIFASVVHLQVVAVVARHAFFSSHLRARRTDSRNAICAAADIRSADCVDAATAVALGAQALEHVNAIHTLGLGAAALNASTLVHVFAASVHTAADPSLGAETLETVILVNALASTSTNYILALASCPPQSIGVADRARLHGGLAGLLHLDERVHDTRAWREPREAIGLVRMGQHYADLVFAFSNASALPDDIAGVEIAVSAFCVHRSR